MARGAKKTARGLVKACASYVQKEIRRLRFAAKADFWKFLYTTLRKTKTKVRVAAPFTVDKPIPSPHPGRRRKRRLNRPVKPQLQAPKRAASDFRYGLPISPRMNPRKPETLASKQAHKQDRITFTSTSHLGPAEYVAAHWPSTFESEKRRTRSKEAAIFMRPRVRTSLVKTSYGAGSRKPANAGSPS